MTLSPNTLLQGGKYRIIRVLGQGGFGITYLAEQTMLGRPVAIKEFFMKEFCERDESTSQVSVPSSGSKDLIQRFRDKFLKEARLIAKMNNRHIVAIYDIFEENSTAYYVMEQLEGGSLADKVSDTALNEAETLRYIYEIAEALGYIHSQNVLHLDVKPTNILFRSNGESVLIDFGISKRYDENGGQTSTTPVGISKGYAPMEQYNQGLTKFSPATDIYSLGATMYKMLTGKVPPEASSLLNDEEELERPANISDTTWHAVEKAMEVRVKKRPQSIAEFLSLLDEQQEYTIVEDKCPNKTTAISEETIVDSSLFQSPLQNDKTLEFSVNGTQFKMVYVEGGTFKMGSDAPDADRDEKPVHSVTLSNYFIGQTEVTQALWKAVMGSNLSWFKDGCLPVHKLSWDNCQKFVNKLNKLTSRKFRLPTEAEWEYAARGGNKSKGYEFSGSNILTDVAWCKGNSGKRLHPVATRQPNELGIYDMSGNVFEICQDDYDGDYYKKSPANNPVNTAVFGRKVVRGGCWYNSERYCRVSFRRDINTSCDYVGIRLALSES